MNKSFNILFVIISLFVSLVFCSKINAQTKILTPTKTPKRKKSVQIEKLELDKNELVYICPYSTVCGKDENFSVKVKTTIYNPKNKPVIYQYKVSGGRIVGQGENVIWDLQNSRPGDYTITVSIDSGKGFISETKTEKISVKECPQCDLPCICPTMSITGSESVKAGETVVFTAKVSASAVNDITYNWKISQGEIVKGEGTSEITIKTIQEMRGYIKVTVEINGSLCAECFRSESKTVEIIK
jgi:hypothetical protein